MYDQVEIAFSPQSLLLLNAILGFMMFGVSLQLSPTDFARVLKAPRAPIAGLLAQFLLLPAATGLLTWWFAVEPSLALGMILVASCPGGTFSNVMTWLAKASVPVSVSMTAVSSLAAMVMTPFNFAFWGNLNPHTRDMMREIAIDPINMVMLVLLVLVLPMIAGMLIGRRFPVLVGRSDKPMRIFALSVFFLFVIVAVVNNVEVFIEHAVSVSLLVVLHNLLAFGVGALAAKTLRLPTADRRAVTIEVGIQNSALALSILFTFFGGAGGMLLIAALWGVWHLISGLTLALIWSRSEA